MKTVPKIPTLLDRRSRVAQILYRAAVKFPLVPSLDRYNMTLSRSHRFLWYRVAKVGTRTLLNHLKDSEVTLDVEHGNWLHYPPKVYEQYFKFAFVRNPWDRIASCWRDKVLRQNYFHLESAEHARLKDFANFVDYVAALNIDQCDRHLRSQCALIDLSRVDFLGRMENFEQDANSVFKQLGLKEKEIVRKNMSSKTKGYREHYTDALAEKVATIYRRDIQIFGYRF